MKALPPATFRAGDTFDPRLFDLVQEWMRRELAALEARRYFHAKTTLPFGTIASGSDASRGQLFAKPPSACGDWEIEALELSVAAPSGVEVTLTASDGSTSISVTATGAGATTWAHARSDQTLKVAAGTEVTFTVTGFASNDVTVRATAHTRYDRHQGQPPSSFSKLNLKDGDTWDATTVAAMFAAFDSDVAAHLAADNALRIEMVALWPGATSFPATDDVQRFPTRLKTGIGCSLYVKGATTGVTATITDISNTIDVNGPTAGGGANTWASSHTTSFGIYGAQIDDQPDTPGYDWKVTWTDAASGTIEAAALALYWL